MTGDVVAIVGLVVTVAAGAAVAAGLRAGLVARAEGRPALAAAVQVPVDEAARLLVAQRRTTRHPDPLLRHVGVGGLLVVALLGAAVVPLGGLVAVRSPVSVVWFNAAEAMLWGLVWLVGWGPNAALSLVAGYRWLAQALAYELPLMFALVCPATAAASLDLVDVAGAQDGLWYGVWMPVALVTYLGAVLALSFWAPLDAPAHTDTAGGVLSELTGTDRLLVQVGRLALLAVGAAAAVPLFLGGGAGLPLVEPFLPAEAWAVGKALVVLAVLVAAGRRLPTLRPDRVVEAAWGRRPAARHRAGARRRGRRAVSAWVDGTALAVLGVLAVVSGALVFRVDSMARATYLLATSFFAVAGVMALLGLPYLAALTVLMMVVEMAMMGVFMVMLMMNPAGLMPMSMFHNTRGAAVLAVGTFVVLAAGALLVDWPTTTAAPPTDTTEQLGQGIMDSKMLVMMTVSPVLLVTMIAGVVLAVRPGRYDRVPHAQARGKRGAVVADGSHEEPAEVTA